MLLSKELEDPGDLIPAPYVGVKLPSPPVIDFFDREFRVKESVPEP